MQKQIPIIALLVFAVLLVDSFPAIGQLKVYPHPHPGKVSAPIKKNISAARTKSVIKRSLPFWDDFSFTPVNDTSFALSNYPVDSLWVTKNDAVNNYTVWINNGMAINPPSVNVATFDGLDSAFLQYSDLVLTNGLRDSLVSQGIILDESEVSLAERNSVFLSFAYQWQGNGEAPDPADYFSVEFRNDSGDWETVLTIYPKSSFQREEFYDTLVKVDGDRFFHDVFQFRFRNYGRLSGPYDTWNLDYVYLNKNRAPDDTDFPDQAISTPLTSLFGMYQSIPYHQLVDNNAIVRPTFVVSNNLDEFTDLSYITEGTFKNYINGNLTETFYSNLGGTDTSAINDNGSGIIFPLEQRTVNLEYPPDPLDPGQFDPSADSVLFNLKVKLFTGDTFDPKTGDFANDYDLNYQPIDFRTNDTINVSYFLKDYYAYDDGIAEYAAGLTQPGNRAAYLFEMVSTVPDTLVGIDIYVPDYGLSANLTADFYVYGDNGGVPSEPLYVIPSFGVQRKGLNNFQRIKIIEPILVESKFYIGWKAPVGPTLKIGLDVSNNAGDKIFVNTNGTWTQSSNISGSLMMRPVFGSGSIVTGVEEERNPISIFPNPSTGEFYIRGEFDQLHITTVTGHPVIFSMQEAGDDHKVTLNNASAGLYILSVQKENHIQTEKLVIK
ncbi:MAG TPA: T9SS type A sorting domain-containing protein [Chryseolinea sp.]|nr:T9SS type A sorting domain-containing protein [Chryseolinea sp.]